MENELTNTNQESTKQDSEKDTATLSGLQAELKELKAANEKLKQSVTNASADASKWKKQYQDKLSDEEKAKQLQDEQTAALQTELETLRKERNIAKISGALVANDIGMNAETAGKVAEAMNAGDIDNVLDGIRQFITAHDKALREDALRNNKTLPGGASTKDVSKEEFDKMGYMELLAFKREHPEQYAEFMKQS